MDVTSDKNLFDFIERFGKEEEQDLTTAAAVAIDVDAAIPTSSSRASNQSGENDVWGDIAEALNNWTQRILDVESRYESKTASFRQTIEDSLKRQQLDGFINHHDLSELRYISDVWTNLLQAISCYTVGCVSVKRDIITYLLELHTLRQINANLLIETCLKL